VVQVIRGFSSLGSRGLFTPGDLINELYTSEHASQDDSPLFYILFVKLMNPDRQYTASHISVGSLTFNPNRSFEAISTKALNSCSHA